MTADEVIVELKAKIQEYKQNLTEARTHFEKEASNIESRSLRMTERMKIHFGAFSLFAYGALAAIPAILAGVIEKSLEYAGSLKEQAQQLGVTAKQLQEYRYAASQVGVTTEQMDRGLAFLTRSFGQIEAGVKKPTKAMADLGFSIKQINEIVQHGAAEGLPKIADAISKIEDPAKRARIEIGLFGRAGQSLDPLLRQGAAGIDGLRNAVEQLGGVLTDEQIERAHQAEIKFKAVKEVLEAQIAGAVANNANAILGLANALLKLIGVLAQIPHYWDQAMVRIAKVDAVAEQGILKADDLTKRAGLGSLLGDTRPWFEKSLAEDQRRIASDPAIVPGASAPRKLRLGPEEPGAENLPLSDYTGDIAKALKAKGHQKAAPEDRFAEQILSAMQEESNLHERLNTALADLAGTEEAKAKAEKLNADERAQREHDQAERQIASIKTEKGLTEAERAELIHQYKINEGIAAKAASIEKQAIDAKENDRLHHEEVQTQVASNQNQQDILKAQESLVTDRRIRAKIEKALVNLAIDQEELAQQEIIDSRTASKAQKDIAQARLGTLETLRGLQLKNVDQQNLSPWQSYVKNLRDGLSNVNDTLEQLAVDNVKKLEDSLAGATAKALHLHGALGDIVTALIRIGIQQAELAAFGGGSNGGGFLGGLLKIFGIGSKAVSGLNIGAGSDFSSYGNLFPGVSFGGARAGGGPVQAGVAYDVGEQGRERFIPQTDGFIVPNDKLRGAVVEVHVVSGEYFDARVGRVTGPVIARAATRAAIGGASLARQQLQTDQLHYLG